MTVRWMGIGLGMVFVLVALGFAGRGGAGGHSSDWNYGYVQGKSIFRVHASGKAGPRCTDMLDAVKGTTFFNGDVHQAIAGCVAAAASLGS